jgi:hypothetical protein
MLPFESKIALPPANEEEPKDDQATEKKAESEFEPSHKEEDKDGSKKLEESNENLESVNSQEPDITTTYYFSGT